MKLPRTNCSVLPVALALVAGCGPQIPSVEDGTGDSGTTNNTTVESADTGDPGQAFPVALSVNKDVDILFVIDNSGSMGQEQAILARSMENFIETLERPGVEANYRIGVTTTDNGNPWCQGTGPEAGALRMTSCRSRPTEFIFEGAITIDATQEACYDLCPEEWTNISVLPTTVEPGGAATPRNWIESTVGVTNLPEGLTAAQAFSCVGPQGINGCGFESHLESMWKALRRSQTEGDTDFGFIRDSAVLSIVHVTDEADCSYNNEHETIFLPDGDRLFWSDPAAPAPTSAVCWNAGVACTGAGTYQCEAVHYDVAGLEVGEQQADDDAVMRPLSRYIGIVQELEDVKQTITPDQQVLVSVIAGVNSDGTITYQDALDDPAFQTDFGIGPGCISSNGAAVPPVRLAEFASAFQVGSQRNLFSVCDQDYGPALESIAEAMADQLRPACMPVCVADTDPSTPQQVDPACTLTQESPLPDGTIDEIAVPPCQGGVPPAGDTVCYETLVGEQMDAFCSEQGYNLQFQIIRQPGVPAPLGAVVMATCSLSTNQAIDCPLLP